jgi:hypothetical protein
MNLVSGKPLYNIYTSTNFGAIWTLNNLPPAEWNWVACSADGKKLFVTGTDGIWTLQTPPSPRLKAAVSKADFNLSWMVPSTNLVLLQSTDLSVWATLTNTPCFNYSNLQEQLTLSPAESLGFYRLVSR